MEERILVYQRQLREPLSTTEFLIVKLELHTSCGHSGCTGEASISTWDPFSEHSQISKNKDNEICYFCPLKPSEGDGSCALVLFRVLSEIQRGSMVGGFSVCFCNDNITEHKAQHKKLPGTELHHWSIHYSTLLINTSLLSRTPAWDLW